MPPLDEATTIKVMAKLDELNTKEKTSEIDDQIKLLGDFYDGRIILENEVTLKDQVLDYDKQIAALEAHKKLYLRQLEKVEKLKKLLE